MSGLLKSGEISEKSMHKTIINWIKVHPKLKNMCRLIIHFPNEGKRSNRYGKLLKELGMRAGVSDLFIAIPNHNYGGAWIELKSKDGILSKEQKEFLSDMREQNFFTCVCYTIDEAINTISWYCFN